MLAVALHKIQDVVDGVRRVTEPGTVFAPNSGDVAALTELGAIREPTTTELALYSLANPKVAAPTPPLAALGNWDGDGRPGGDAGAKAEDPPVNEYGLVAVHKGGGKYIVNDAEGNLVSGETALNKTSAAQWIADYKPAAPTDGEDDDVV